LFVISTESHNIHMKQTSMQPAGFKPTIPGAIGQRRAP